MQGAQAGKQTAIRRISHAGTEQKRSCGRSSNFIGESANSGEKKLFQKQLCMEKVQEVTNKHARQGSPCRPGRLKSNKPAAKCAACYHRATLPRGTTMTFSIYSASIPVFKQMLGSLSAILDKAETHVQDKKIDPNALLNFRLFPDMLPFVRQIQIATDFAKG